MFKSTLIAEQLKKIRPLLKEANPQQKLKLMKLMKVALKENFDERMALIRKLVRTGKYDASDLELATTEQLRELLDGQHGLDEDQTIPLSGKISARPNQDPNSFEDWDYYHQGEPIQPGSDIHTKVKDVHLRQREPAYDTMRNAFDNPIQPGPILPQNQSGDTIIPSRPKPAEKIKDADGKPIRLKDFVPHDPDIMEDDLKSIDPDDHGETEGRFVKNQIQTMLRVLSHLENAIGDDENLPEWVQMLLSQSQDKIVGVMDYMISAKELAKKEQTGNQSIMSALSMLEGEKRTKTVIPNKKKVKESKDFLQEK